MPFNPQNLAARAQQIGRDVESFSTDLSNSIRAPLANAANISVNGINSAIEGAAGELSGAVNNLSSGLSNAIGGALGGLAGGLFGGLLGGLSSALSGIATPQENILSKFASYNCIFTFGVLSVAEINFPDFTYRRRGPNIVILKSGGTGRNQVRTAPEMSAGITGEYFIDDVEIDSIIAPNPKTKQSNATMIRFNVLEPYSMGVFLQSLQVAALQGGHKNYLEAPYLLQVEFIGWDDNGRPVNLKNARRMFPLKLANVTFNVTESGSQYAVEAIPWNEQAFSNEVQQTKTDFDIKGATIAELLQTGPESLASILNNRELEQLQAGNRKSADQYVIMFPKSRSFSGTGGTIAQTGGATTQSVTDAAAEGVAQLTEEQKQKLYEQLTGIIGGQMPADFDAELSKLLGIVVRRSKIGEALREYAEKDENINAIGNSKIVKSFLDEGKQSFGKPAFTVDPQKPGVFQRGNITISDEGRRINFRRGSKIQDMIEEIILLSEYARQFVTEVPDANGMKTWFKIETHVYTASDSGNVDQTGQPPKVYVYRVIPYKVHVSRIAGPTQSAPGFPNLKRQAVKEYNYIYTGKNDDIINFDIQINSAFYTAISGDFGQGTQQAKTGGANMLAAPPPAPIHGAANGQATNLSQTGTATARPTPGPNTGNSSGGAMNHSENQIARTFNDAIVNSPVDLVSAEIEIWGDPYYITDSGMGNYSAGETGVLNITADGSMDYQSSEVDVLINFRTPIDIGNDGYMKFPSSGSKTVGAFSGLYQVTTVKNKFSANKFTQELTTIRRRNQPTDSTGTAVDINIEAIIEKGLSALISPLTSGPASAIAGAADQLNNAIAGAESAINGATGQIQNAVQQGISQLNSVTSNIPTIPAQQTADSISSRINDIDQAGRIRGGL